MILVCNLHNKIMQISVIIPTVNEEQTIEKTLEALSRLVNISEIIVVDGGSIDDTVKIVTNFEKNKKIKLISIEDANRGKQFHEGAKYAEGDIFWFLHADAKPIQGSGKQIKKFARYSEVVGGNFEILFSGKSFWAKFLTWLYPHLRSLGLAYGDSAFFVKREIYEQIGGFQDFPIFEDLDLLRKVKKKGRFVNIKMPVTVSSRRFENRSFLWTFIKWSVLQGLYWVGISPRVLGKSYKQVR